MGPHSGPARYSKLNGLEGVGQEVWSQLSLWFKQRYGPGTRRSRRVGIVAVARKLLVALWRYLETGVLPEGAVLKSE